MLIFLKQNNAEINFRDNTFTIHDGMSAVNIIAPTNSVSRDDNVLVTRTSCVTPSLGNLRRS